MKLRNKKTGEIGELHFEPNKEYHFTVATEDPADMMIFKTLAELNKEWEDYEEDSWYWYIGDGGDIHKSRTIYKLKHEDEASKEIGNYFETQEEANKAVEKLKAWKRLKDRGFKFDKVSGCWIEYTIKSFDSEEECEQAHKDLDLLFGGEE